MNPMNIFRKLAKISEIRVKPFLFLLLLVSAFRFPLSAFPQSNITASVTVTNALGITNGHTFTVGATTWTVTNSSLSARYIYPTNTAPKAATNLYNKVSNALTNRYFFAYGSPTNFTIRTRSVADTLSASLTGSWGIIVITTNAAGGASVGASNITVTRLTFADGTYQTTAGGSGSGFSTNVPNLQVTNSIVIGTNNYAISNVGAQSYFSGPINAPLFTGSGAGLDSINAAANGLATTASVTTVSNQTYTASNALAIASNIRRYPVVSFTGDTNYLFTWGGTTSLFQNITFTWNGTIGGHTNTPAANKRIFYINSAGFGQFTNVNAVLVTNISAGFSGRYTNTGVGYGFIAEYRYSLPVTNYSDAPYFNQTNASYFGYGFYGGIPFFQTNVSRKAFPVLITADGQTINVGSAMAVEARDGVLRDPSISERYNGHYLLACTTNLFDGAGFGSPALELRVGTKLGYFSHFTNLSFVPTNYSVHPTNMRTWKASFAQIAGQVWMAAGVSTNNGVSFETWIRTTPTNNFPFGGFTEPVVLNQFQTTYTNLVDGTLKSFGSNMCFAVPDIGAGLIMRMGYFQTTNPSSPFMWTSTADASGWGSGVESPYWFEYFTPDGQKVTGLGMVYGLSDYGGRGDAFTRKVAIVTNFNPLETMAQQLWSGLKHVNNPDSPDGLGYLQNIIPIQISSTDESDQVNELVAPVQQRSGSVALYPESIYFTNLYGVSKFGWPAALNAAMPDTNTPWVGHFIPRSGQGMWFTPQGETVFSVMGPNTQTNRALTLGSNYAAFGNAIVVSGNIPATNLTGTVPAARLMNTNAITDQTTFRLVVFLGTNAIATNVIPNSALTGASVTNMTLVSPSISGAVTNTATVTNSGVQAFSAHVRAYGNVAIDGTLTNQTINGPSFAEIKVGGTRKIAVLSSVTQLDQGVEPTTDNGFTIGTSSKRWLSVYSSGYYTPSNTLTMATIVGGITNNGGWIGMISNCLMSVTMSNNAATWKQINP